MAEIPDGTSNTLAMMEILQTPTPLNGNLDRRGRIWNDDTSTYQVSARITPNSKQPDVGTCGHDPARNMPWTETGNGTPANCHLGARSRHPGASAACSATGRSGSSRTASPSPPGRR